MSQTSAPSSAARGPTEHGVRDQIVVAAAEHFSKYGYEKTTVSDLAREIGFSKAYIYKFFDSKQAIGEVICANCLQDIVGDVATAMAGASTASEQLRRMIKALAAGSVRLFSQDRKLHEIAAAAASERWQPAVAYEDSVRVLIERVLRAGRDSGEFERKTPLDEATQAIWLVVMPYISPLFLQHNFDLIEAAPTHLSGLILRSLSP